MLDLLAEQHQRGQAYHDLYEAVADLKKRHDLHPCSVRPRDGLSLRRDDERDAVEDLVKRFRGLPAEQQRHLPALLNSLAQLEVVVGDLDAGQRDFQEVADLVEDPISQGEAYHNVYRAALERRAWHEALMALRQAVELDRDAFEPFPTGRYRPLRILGAGGFGVTFLCHDDDAGLDVVVKALRPDSLDRDVATVFREFASIQDLDHSVLIRVRDFGLHEQHAGKPYVVLDHFEGQTLLDYVTENGPLSPEEWLQIAWPVARGLQALHGRGVLHRNLRPACVLVRKEASGEAPARWRVKLIDIALSLKRSFIHAAASHPDAQVRTSLGRSVTRTVAYSPPEVISRPRGMVWVGPHSDVFNFGKLSLFALTGKPNPDSAHRLILSEAWGQFLDHATAWAMSKRLPDFNLVLDRLAQLAGSGEVTFRLDHDLEDATIAELADALEKEPDKIALLINRGNAYARQGEHQLAITDFSRALELQAVDQPGRANLLRRRALAHARLNAFDQAVADFTEAIGLEPRDVEAHANRGLVYSQMGEHELAIADYNEALALNPRDVVVLYNRGNAHFTRGELEQAIKDYTEVIRQDPDHAWAFGNRGRAFAQLAGNQGPDRGRGDYRRAIADFSRVLELDPGNVKALWDRAHAQRDIGEHERAIEDFTAALRHETTPLLYVERGLACAAINDFEAAIADFSEAILLDPQHAKAFVFRANALLEQGKGEDALNDYSEAARISPDWDLPYYNRGLAHARLGRLDEAAADFTRAIELQPGDAAAYFNRGNIRVDLGELDEAVADYTSALAIDPNDAATCTNRGNAYNQLGEVELALTDYDRALELLPGDVMTLLNRANLYRDQGDFEQARLDYDEALRTAPDHARGYYQRGLLHLETSETDAALADFSRAIQHDPAMPGPYHQRGRLHAQRREDEPALADFTEAIRLDPGRADCFYERGSIHALRGEDEQALADLNEAIRLQPDHAGACLNRGCLYHRRGDSDALEAALADYSAAINADPEWALPWFNRATVQVRRGDLEAALGDCSAALRLDPDDLAFYHQRARILAGLGRFQEAIADGEEALKRDGNDPRTYNNLAWLLATCPDETQRNPARALELARRGCELTEDRDLALLDTLAAALAACGQFEEAIGRQRQVIEQVPEEERTDYQRRLELYESGQVYLDS